MSSVSYSRLPRTVYTIHFPSVTRFSQHIDVELFQLELLQYLRYLVIGRRQNVEQFSLVQASASQGPVVKDGSDVPSTSPAASSHPLRVRTCWAL